MNEIRRESPSVVRGSARRARIRDREWRDMAVRWRHRFPSAIAIIAPLVLGVHAGCIPGGVDGLSSGHGREGSQNGGLTADASGSGGVAVDGAAGGSSGTPALGDGGAGGTTDGAGGTTVDADGGPGSGSAATGAGGRGS